MKNHSSNGPVSSLPGALFTPEAGTTCDQHENVLAVKKIQGETDTYGCEYRYVCSFCLTSFQQAMNLSKTGLCDWCHQHATTLRDHRDADEGMAGRIYRVCAECRSKELEQAREELEHMQQVSGEQFLDSEDDYYISDDDDLVDEN